ncbi:2-oxoglutarate dehydrogenase, e3 component,lipoamidedehydrogenase-like protein [Leishmania major strain Friedlin]|uniref:2-oxoglutarate dehydrogenase, e3 component,lipoamidedehydrogenase-like protein n=1 Tax=Leishmania major TaxID=5664 RepID=Q4Q5Z7_LEIMA|nr:2-oxoglutarate dehydrogenase, e3 component,lipoamidedehydrogenase-like protein [Leishmania major strain Friedlin]CAJ08475.1 2-oxoglutarate dehydrogenase, e3 component,lipoamidedehydrogenase-like protein [Leishmania major strain Friedlin]|eukprot:XP_001685251.1 2-oxoglutarate dehydrogenase, e3 component,lipoamidedehydrogenase-like protein [Leishmania major strain Friedlin]
MLCGRESSGRGENAHGGLRSLARTPLELTALFPFLPLSPNTQLVPPLLSDPLCLPSPSDSPRWGGSRASQFASDPYCYELPSSSCPPRCAVAPSLPFSPVSAAVKMLFRSSVQCNVPFPVLRSAGAFPRVDLCVIGGGPGGIAAAMRAIGYGKSVCIVEGGRVGGADLGGTVPSKMMYEIAHFAASLTGPEFVRDLVKPDEMQSIVDGIPSERITQLLRKTCTGKEREYRAFLEASGVQLIEGKATFANPNEIDVHTEGTGEYRSLQADNVVIATGAIPRSHAFAKCDHNRILNSTSLFEMPIPASMVVIGAGAMGCEVASMFAKLGRTKVRLVDKAPRILPKEDEDVASYVQRHLIRRGVVIHQGCRLFDLEAGEEDCRYSLRDIFSGDIETYHAERAMVAVGRQPNLGALGLENTKMRVENGQLDCDEYGRCKPYKHIYCIGDATGRQKTVNTAQTAGQAVVDTMFGCSPKLAVSNNALTNIATDMFLEDEVASIGLSEKQCRASGIGYIVARLEYKHLTRPIVMGAKDGFVKMIVTNDREKRVLGVRAVGPHAGSVVEVASLPILKNESVYTMLKHNPAYPSLVSGVIECAAMLVGRGARCSNVVEGISIKNWTPVDKA